MSELTERERASLVSIRGGVDVYSYGIASDLRSVQKKMPELLMIVKPQAYEGDGTDQMPYFGAILSQDGEYFLEMTGGDQ